MDMNVAYVDSELNSKFRAYYNYIVHTEGYLISKFRA